MLSNLSQKIDKILFDYHLIDYFMNFINYKIDNFMFYVYNCVIKFLINLYLTNDLIYSLIIYLINYLLRSTL
jgi:hypothetical protein